MHSDGIICYWPLHGKSEKERDRYSAPVCKTIYEAINKSYELWKKHKDDKG